ncbi:hypothetical protein [Prosthecobacter sp.]|uniref:hypothetical protein n=1 Tax=Prosthecobacter sp. TaxID=1965333 RepID=UPI003784392C
MPLSEDQQKTLNTLTHLAKTVSGEVGKYEDFFRQAEAINHFNTGGKQPDLSQLSDQDLRDMFDAGSRSAVINEVDLLEPEHKLGSIYLERRNITSARGPESRSKGPDVPASREYLEGAVSKWMEVQNFAHNPRDLLQAQMIIRDSPGMDLGNKVQQLQEKYEALRKAALEKSGVSLRDEGIEQTITELKSQQREFEQRAHQFKEEGMRVGARLGVEHATKQNFSAEKVALEMHIISIGDAENFQDISGANIRGLDLSQSDLSRVRIDAETLSQAKGLETVKGVEPRLLAEAQAIKPHLERLEDLHERLGKLDNKGGVMANLRNIRHGGVDGERKHLQKEILKAQEALKQTKANLAAQAPAVENEFEQRNTYGLGTELTVRPETEASLAAKKNQASETFRVDSAQALDSRGTKFAIGKRGLGDKTAELQQNLQQLRASPAPNPEDKDAVKARRNAINAADDVLEKSAAKDVNVLGTMAPLYGRETEVGSAIGGTMVQDAAAKKAVLGADTSTLLTRAVASSAVNKALGMDAVAEERFAIDAAGQSSTLSVVVPGAPILTRPTADKPQESFLQADYKHPDVQKGLFDLEAQDYITGQIDRHTGNIFVDPHSNEVRGIDNDLAFPVVGRENLLKDDAVKSKAVATKPMFMHADTADKIEAMKSKDLRAALQSIETPPGIAGLEPDAIEGAVNRLKELKDHIKDLRKDGRVVDKFNDATFEKARAAQIEVMPGKDLAQTTGIPPPASYLGAAIAESAKTLAINQEMPENQHRNILKKDDVPKSEIDPQFAAYQQGVQDARAEIAANPQQLQNAGLAKTITDGQARLQQLQDQLQAQDETLKTSAERLSQASLNGDSELAEGFEEIMSSAQDVRVKTLKELKTEQQKVSAALDEAVAPRKNEIASQARLATAQVQVEQPQNVVNVESNQARVEAEDLGKFEAKAPKAKIEKKGSEELVLNDPGVQMEAEEATEVELDLNEPAAQIEVDGDLNEQQEVEVNGLNQPTVEAQEMDGAGEQEQTQDVKKTSRIGSVRDALRSAASSAKTSVADRLERKGGEQKLGEVDAGIQAKYKDLQKQLSDPDKKAAAQKEMDAMKKESPGLKQMDRSKVGQVINSGLRDAAKSVGSKLKA